MQTLELADGSSINPIHAGLQILDAAQETFWTTKTRDGLMPVSKDVDVLGDPVILYEKKIDQAIKDSVASIFGDNYVLLSEESGLTVVGKKPQVLIAYDDIDGTKELRINPRTGLYGPTVAIFDNINPTFGDAVFGGYTILKEHRTYYWDGEQSIVQEPKRGSRLRTRERQIHTSGATELNASTRLNSMEEIEEIFHVDYDPVRQVRQAHGITARPPRHRASIVHHARVADAARKDAIDGAEEFRRKRDLEAGAGFKVLRGAGGDIITFNDRGEAVSLGEFPFLGFDQKRRDHIMLAATPELGRRMIGAR